MPLRRPLVPLVVLAVAALLATREGWLRRVGEVLVVLAALLFMVGALGEAVAPGTPDVSKTVLVTSGVIGVLVALAVVGAAFASRGGTRTGGRSGRPAPTHLRT